MKGFALLSWTCLISTACSTGPAWTPIERVELKVFQEAVRQRLLESPSDRDEPKELGTLPEGATVNDLDEHGALARDLRHDHVAVTDATGGVRIPCKLLWWMCIGPVPFTCGETEDGVAVAAAGCLLAGFDHLHAVAAHAYGAAMLATRRGEQTVVVGDRVWSGSLWSTRWRPELSQDGRWFAYVRPGLFRDTPMVAPTDAPTQGTELHYDGVVQWPIWLGRDKSHVRAVVRVGGRVEVRDNERVVATGARARFAVYHEDLDLLTLHLGEGETERLLVGERLTPPLREYRWLALSRDGAHYLAVGRDGDEDHLIVDGDDVLRHPKMTFFSLAKDGSEWAIAVQEQDGQHVVTRAGRQGPFERVADLAWAPDGKTLAIETQTGRVWAWQSEGKPIGPEYDRVKDVEPLAGRRGVVFKGHDAAGWWLVTPAGRDGPWDRIGRHRIGSDGKRIVFLAQRGRNAWRRALELG